MAINPAFLVAAVDLSEVFLDKDTGAPLSGGIVSFFQDSDRVTPKVVYTIEKTNLGLPPTYTYVPLPDPIVLNATGQFQDNNGNNIPVYYYPVDANGVLQLYYITVTNSQGTQQFTRQAWPPNEGQVLPPPAGSATGLSNQISDSQFVNVNFVPPSFTYTFAGAINTTIPIAPDWNLVVVSSGAGTVTVTRNPIAGSSVFPFNPPYTLTFTPTGAVTSLQLVQTLFNNPDIFAQTPTNPGFVATTILLGPGSTVTITYAPNGGVAPFPFLLLTATNGMAGPQQVSNTVQLPIGANASNGDTGFVNIIIALAIAAPTTISNVQIVPLTSNLANIPYDQRTSNREQDFQFNYYGPLLKYKAISSFLVGWDFPYNPTQFLGPTLAASASGANTSRYVWDQTIVFQTTNSGPAQSRAPSGALRITATNASQFALIQYLSQAEARKILNQPLSVNVASSTSVVAGLVGTVSLWYTANPALPSCAANNSIVATLDANGLPATFNTGGAGDTWHQVPRSNLNNAQFTVMPSANTNTNDYGFGFWNLNGIAAANTATFFAIVVGFAQLPIGQTIDFESISLVPGSLPTRPAPLTASEHLRNCQYYYNMSFNIGTIPAQGIGFGHGENNYAALQPGALAQPDGWVVFPVEMISTPTVLTYNPINANIQVYNSASGADLTLTATGGAGQRGFALAATGDAGCVVGNGLRFNWTADARLGV